MQSNLIESKVRELSSVKSYSEIDSQALQDITNTNYEHRKNSKTSQAFAKQSQDHEPNESKMTNNSSYF